MQLYLYLQFMTGIECDCLDDTLLIVNDFKLCLKKLACKITWACCLLHRIIDHKLNFINFIEIFRFPISYWVNVGKFFFFSWRNLFISSKFPNLLLQIFNAFSYFLYLCYVYSYVPFFYFQYFFHFQYFYLSSFFSILSEVISLKTLKEVLLHLFHLFISFVFYLINFYLILLFFYSTS